MIRLIGGDEVCDPGVAAGHLQDSHLMGDLSPAVAAAPPLPDELCSKRFPRGLLHTALHHSKLPPEEPETHDGNTDRQSSGNPEAALCCCFKYRVLIK